jgi:type IV pilus assembly protein PilM
MGLFSSSADNNYVGIDIGDSSLKMVELVKKNKKLVLSNYGFGESLSQAKFTSVEDVNYLAKALIKIKKDLGIVGNRATVSLPTFSVFSSVLNLYNVNRKNLAEQINEEAKKVIPLPLEEMVLDYKIIPAKEKDDPANTKVFLTGSPKKLIKKYINVFNLAKINLVSLETETFSLVRSLLGSDPATVMIIELGGNSTDFCIIKESIPYLNRSINVSGALITKTISQKMDLPLDRAEQFKIDLGLSVLRGEKKSEMPDAIMIALNPIINEVKYMIDLYQSSNNEKIEKIILSGGGALLANFANYLENLLNIKVIVGNPWFRVVCPTELQEVLTEVGPKLSVAVGLALRGAE